MASKIERNARKPLDIIRTIPSEGWNQELERLFYQIRIESYTLSGMHFFHINKRLLSGLAGALITYELVLLQFHKKDEIEDSVIDCEKVFNAP